MTSRVLLALAACSLFYAAVAVEYFPSGKRDGVIITSHDLTAGNVVTNIPIDMTTYYIYGTYSSNTNNAPNIQITDGSKQTTLETLHNRGLNNKGKLTPDTFDGKSGNLKITRANYANNNTDYFTLYLTTKQNAEVYSAKTASGNSIGEQGGLLSVGVIILSADRAISLSKLIMGSSATLELHVAPNDIFNSNNDNSGRVYTVDKKEYANHSVALIASPVTTIFLVKPDAAPNITFNIDVNPNYNNKLDSGSVLTVTSAGYKNKDGVFNNYEYDRTVVPNTQTYNYTSQSLLSSYGQGKVDVGQTVAVAIGSGSSHSATYDKNFDQSTSSNRMGQQKADAVSITVTTNSTNANSLPSYYVMITSGSSLLNSLAALIVAACLALTQ